MPNYAPYVIVLIDSILLSTISQQLWFRYRVYRKYAKVEVVREQVVHRRKDIYRVLIAFLLAAKTCDSFCWLLYQGWDSFNLRSYIKPWLFWIFYGCILSICILLKGDFASVVVGIEQNILGNGKKKGFWHGLLMGAAVLSSILCMWGIALSIFITNAPIWQYMGFSTSILNGFITYKMLKSIISTTRETQASTYHVRTSITAKEFEKQLFTLFHMKQMVAALIFIGFYAIYTFIVNLYHMVNTTIIAQPFIGNAGWYLYSKLIVWNLYTYSMVCIVLIYTWISYMAMREAAIKAKRTNKITTPDLPDDIDIVILPDTVEIIYPPNIDPNDPDNLYNGTDTEDNLYNGMSLYPNASRANSANPSPEQHAQPRPASNSVPMRAINTMISDPNMISKTNSGQVTPHIMGNPGATRPTSPGSILSVLSGSNTDNNLASMTDIFPIFGHKLSVRQRGESSMLNDANVAGVLYESHKTKPHTTMLDMNILSLVKRGCSLERIYFDAQKYRGITPKSLKLTAKMRSVSYSSRLHSRRNTVGTGVNTQENELILHSRSVPNMSPLCTNVSTDDLSVESSQYRPSLQEKYSESETINSELKSVKPNVFINAYKSIDITVPEDAVLTPNNGNWKANSLDVEMQVRNPQKREKQTDHDIDMGVDIIDELHEEKENISYGSGSRSLPSDHSDVSGMDIIGPQMPDVPILSKVEIYSNSRSMDQHKM